MGLFEPEPVLEIHAEGALDELLSPQLAAFCARLEPFGKDNPAPVFLTRRAQVLNWGYVGAQGQHLKLHVSPAVGAASMPCLGTMPASGEWL